MRIALIGFPLLVWCMTACERGFDPEGLAQAATVTKPAASAASDGERERAKLHDALMPWLSRKDALPHPLPPNRCPDDRIAADAKDDAARTLLLRVEDARFERKGPLALKLTRHMTSLDLSELEAGTLGNDARVAPEISEKIRWLGVRRYVGVFHVTELEPPHWIHRLGHMHPEWIAGIMLSSFVIHDAQTGDALCSARLLVKNDTTGVPVAARTRSEVGERLTEALGTLMRERAHTELAKMSQVLRLEAAQ